MGWVLLAVAGVLTFAPAQGELRSGSQSIFRSGPVPEMSVVLAARDTEYCGYHTACGPGKRTDTILYAHIRGSEATLIAIPRDLLVEFEGIRGKINAVYGRAGADGLRRVVEQVLGVPVEHYAIFTFEAVMKAVDAVDGVDVVLDQPMKYTDRAAGLFIDFPAGPVHLNGKDAVKYMRFRHGDGSDYGRLDRIKSILTQVTDKAKQPRYWSRLPGLAQEVLGQVETDMALSNALSFIPFVRGASIRSVTLPTYEEGSYLMADATRRIELIQGLFGAMNQETAQQIPAASVAVLDGGLGVGQGFAQGFPRLGLPIPTVVAESSNLPNGIYLYVDNPLIEAGRYYSDLLHLPMYTRYRPVVPGYDVAIVIGSTTAP